MTDFDRDPEALAWARAKVQRVIDKYARFEREASERGNPELAMQWRKFKNLLRMELVGSGTCVITAFDARRVHLPRVEVGDGHQAGDQH